MSKDREKSAVDAIYEILDKLESLEKKMTIIDNNIKLLNNKVSGLEVKSPSAPAPAQMPAGGYPRAVAPVALVPPKKEEPAQNIKVFGRIKNKRKKPIKDLDVRIFSPKGEMIKSRSTNKDGYWEARIPPGEYGVEYDPSNINKRLRPVNFKIVVEKGIKELDISEINKL